MDAVLVQMRTKLIQSALRIVILLQLASYLWPKDAVVKDFASYDFIIVGGGTAGSILAYRLSESRKFRVLLIEAGGDPPIESLYPGTYFYLPNSKHDWNFTTINDGYTAQEHQGNILELTSGQMLGGDSSLGHSLFIRGDPHDFDHWAEVTHDESWNYKNILPYFKKIEYVDDQEILDSPYGVYHGTEGNMGVSKETHEISQKYLQAFKETGSDVLIDGNGEHILGYFEPMFMNKDGIRQSTAYTYLSLLKNQPNFDMMKETEVIEILFDKDTAVGVKALKNNKLLTLKATREVILSAGAIKSPHLLLLSGIGPKDQLETFQIPIKSDLPVGKNYQDHLGIILVHRLNIDDEESPVPNPHSFPLPVVVGNKALMKSQDYPDYQTLNYIIQSDSEDILPLCSIAYSFKDDICQSLYNSTKGKETILTKLILLHPQSRGHVVLQNSNYSVPPMIISGFYTHDEDLENSVAYIGDFLKVANTSVFKKFDAEFVKPHLPECDNFPEAVYWKCYARSMMGTTFHYTSTCPMGSVVDNRLRVLGVKRLRVVDASVIPVSPSGHTQAPVMAIAEKAADMILEDNALDH